MRSGSEKLNKVHTNLNDLDANMLKFMCSHTLIFLINVILVWFSYFFYDKEDMVAVRLMLLLGLVFICLNLSPDKAHHILFLTVILFVL